MDVQEPIWLSAELGSISGDIISRVVGLGWPEIKDLENDTPPSSSMFMQTQPNWDSGRMQMDGFGAELSRESGHSLPLGRWPLREGCALGV